MRRHGTWLVADIYNGDYIEEIGRRDGWPEDILRKNRETTDIQRRAFTQAVRAGVRIAFGTDSGVLVLDKGFAWRGETYRSLSAIARAITGAHWNGWAFFGLKRPTKEAPTNG